jgi:hypothetical protein
MTNPMDAVAAALPAPTAYPRTSRYYGAPTAVHTGEGGRPVPHLRPRLLPPAESFAVIGVHVVTDGERPDLLSYQHLGDAEAWWRIADANPVLAPDELTDTPGRELRITLPQGIPGPADG